MREFLIENALMWLNDYGFDGLRFDAVHALKDTSDRHFLIEMAETLRHQVTGRQVHLMLENEANQAHLLERTDGRTSRYDAQWGDDFHNSLHVVLTGETEGYYRAFADKPAEHLVRSLTEEFAYQGETFPLSGEPRGEPSGHLPPEATIFFAQNHDQIGNRALGERLSSLIGFEKLKLAMTLVLLSPHIPLLFMGEEAAAETPFLFFADWSGEAADLTRQGRRREFSHFKSFSTMEKQEKIPDPCDERTFAASKLDWQGIDASPRSREFREFTRELLELRKTRIVPLIKQGLVSATGGPIDRRGPQSAIQVCWRPWPAARCQSRRRESACPGAGPRRLGMAVSSARGRQALARPRGGVHVWAFLNRPLRGEAHGAAAVRSGARAAPTVDQRQCRGRRRRVGATGASAQGT